MNKLAIVGILIVSVISGLLGALIGFLFGPGRWVKKHYYGNLLVSSNPNGEFLSFQLKKNLNELPVNNYISIFVKDDSQ